MSYNYESPNPWPTEYDNNTAYLTPTWDDPDPSQFLYDSPQPETRSLANQQANPQQAHTPSVYQKQGQGNTQQLSHQQQSHQQQQQHRNGPANPSAHAAAFSMPSSASESSDHSSSSTSSAQKKRKSSRSSTPPELMSTNSFIEHDVPSSAYQVDKAFTGTSNNYPPYGSIPETTFPNPGFGNLSLDTVTSHGNSGLGFGPNDSPEFISTSLPGQGHAFQDSRLSAIYPSSNASPVQLHLLTPRILANRM